MFSFDLSPLLKKKLEKINKKDKVLAAATGKKIEEIINNDGKTIDRYKNLRYDLSDRKRIHIKDNVVLTFKVMKKENFILFMDLGHIDEVYKR
ncbi:MAG: addiction module toxin RelE [Candidatus Woesearchaeota archaeon]